MIEYADRLRQAMAAAPMDVTSLAKAMGLSYQAVKRVLDGKSAAFTAPNNSAAARILGVSTDWLATGEGQVERNDAGAPWPFSVTRAQCERLEAEDFSALDKTLSGFVLGRLASQGSEEVAPKQAPVPRYETDTHGNRMKAVADAIEAVATARRPSPNESPFQARGRRSGSR